jgi:hypothetical protein
MLKYNGGLLLALMMASSGFAMENQQDGKYENLKAKWDTVIKKQEDFDNLHGDKWRTDPVLKQERDELQNEHRIYMNACMNAAPRDLIKPHGITLDQPVVNANQESAISAGMKKYCRTIDEITVSAALAEKQKLEAQPQAQILQKILKDYDELWDALSNSAQGKKGQELADIVEQLDFIQDQKTALSDALKKNKSRY